MNKEQRDIVKKELILLTKKDVMEITGWSKGVTDRLFAHDRDFPAIKIGKSSQVEFQAFKEFFKERRDYRGGRKNGWIRENIRGL